MFCYNCGKEISNEAYVCPHCGVKVEKSSIKNADADSGSRAGWGVLSFLVPIVGLILFLVWKEERPQTSKICGICALISFVMSIILGFVMDLPVPKEMTGKSLIK